MNRRFTSGVTDARINGERLAIWSRQSIYPRTNATLAELVSLVASGTQVVVTQAGNPVARLVLIDAVIESRVPDLNPRHVRAE